MKEIFLLPGELCIAKEPSLIRTILGSCVAVVLFDYESTFSGVNHFLLPRQSEFETKLSSSSRYGDIAIQALYEGLISAGSQPNRLAAKIFGGAAVVSSLQKGFLIGEHNITQAQLQLSSLRIPIVEQCIGGERGRKLEVFSSEFKVNVQFMNRI